MGRVAALGAAFLEQPQGAELCQDLGEDPLASIMLEQALAKLAQHTGVKAVVVEWQVQGKFPIQARAYGVCRAAVGQIFEMLEHRHERDGDWRERRFALDMVQVGEVKVVKLGIERLADQAVGAVGCKMVGTPGGDFGWHLARRLRLYTHRAPPTMTFCLSLIVARYLAVGEPSR